MQAALNDHEAITFRPRSEGRKRHEFPAMVAEMVKRMRMRLAAEEEGGAATAAAVGSMCCETFMLYHHI